MRKGYSEAMGLTIVTFFAVALIAGIGTERVASLNDRIALNTVGLAAQRVEVGVYMMDAVKEGEMQVEMKDEYNLTVENGERYVLYEFESFIPTEDETRRSKIDPPALSTSFSVEEGKSRFFCISKQNSVTVKPGKC